MKGTNVLETVIETCRMVRHNFEKKYGEDLQGKCIEASETIQKMLLEKGIETKLVEGWCHYDDSSTCSDRDYDEHTWLECDGLYIDITADQFSYFIDEKIPKILVGDKPYYMKYEEPKY